MPANDKGHPDRASQDLAELVTQRAPTGERPGGWESETEPFLPGASTTRTDVPTHSLLIGGPKVGDRLGGGDGKRFELLERLGGGGMATVFLARDAVLDRTVAIKFITHEFVGAAWASAVERVRLEARACARLSHENIVRLFDIGTEEGIPFLVMEYLEGRSLDTVVREEGIDARRAVRIMAEIARGLSAAHRAGIIHRDLKPSNVFIVKDGTAKILDFGVATMAAGLDRMGLQLSGTPRYMSPEQWRGEAQDGRTDIWAAGVMFFEFLTGTPPFSGERVVEVRDAVLSAKPAPSLRDARPDLPDEAHWIAQRAMSKNPADRFGTADELLYSLVALEVALTPSVRSPQEHERPARPRPERRQTTVFSCSLCDLVALSDELEIDDLGEVLDAFFEVCATVVRQLEGTLLSALGGRVVACFGYPTAHEDDAQRAIRAASLVIDAIRSLTRADGSPHAVRTGVHTSYSIVGRPETSAAAPILQGDAPHVAEWLERRARPDEILIGPRTQLLARSVFEVEPLGDQVPDEGARPLGVFRVVRPREGASRFDPVASHAMTPLVGRDQEVDELRALWRRAQAGEGQFVLLVGEAGIGKSRVVELCKEQVSGEPHARIECQCWPHFRNSALQPFLAGLMRRISLRHEDSAQEKIQKLEAALAALDLPVVDHLPLLASFLAIPTGPDYPPPSLSPDLLKKRVLDTIVAVVARLAAVQPTLLLVEDIHWSDASTMELLDLILAGMARMGLMVVVTARPECQPSWPQRAHFHRMGLERLSSSQAAAMVAFASQGRSLPADLVEQLVRRADGVPLYIEELTRMVADTRQAGQDAQGFAAHGIPATLEELLRARLSGLPDEGREVARLAAVLGRDISYQLMLRASHLPEEALHAGLMQLVEAGILRRRRHGAELHYLFKHALLQDAAYQSLVKSKRRHHHERAAETLVAHFPDTVEQHPELVGGHFAEAGRYEEAIAYLEKAGQRAVQRSAVADAVSHYGRALEQLAALPESGDRDRRELALRLAYGAPLMATRGYAAPEVRENYARARELARRAGDDAQIFLSVLGLWQYYMVGGEARTSAEIGQQLVAQADRAADRVMSMLAYRALGTSLMLLGDLAGCRDRTEAGLALYDVREHGKLALRFGQDPGVTNGLYLAWMLWFLGRPDRAIERGRDAVRLARQIEHPLSIAFSLNYLATLHNYRGEYGEARQLADEATAISGEHKLALWAAMSKIQRGWSQLGRGENAGADELKEGVAGWCQTGARAGLTFFLAVLAWGQWQSGQLGQAMDTVVKAEAFMEETGERFFQAEILRVRGEVLLAGGGDPAGAAACFERGLAIAREQQARAWELRLAQSWSRLLARSSRPAEARALLAPIVDWFCEGLETADLRDARALLAAL